MARLIRRPEHVRSAYTRRIMVSLAASLLLVIGLLHVPFHGPSGRIGWTSNPLQMLSPLEILPPMVTLSDGLQNSALITDFGLHDEVVQDEPEEAGLALPEEELPRRILAADARRLDSHRILNFAEEQPEIVGGLAGYYLNIEYPEAAREAGIQGRLLLSFVVERDGRASDIRVEQSLHPLCDSAAVDALRRSRFIAGRQNGETVRVRMRLPVRFILLDDSPVLSTANGQSGGS